MKTFLTGIIISGGLTASLHLLHAQGTATAIQSTQPDSIVQLTADAQGLAQVSPLNLPRAGTFWVIVPGYGGNVTALPYPLYARCVGGIARL
jgi:hypothetical protein